MLEAHAKQRKLLHARMHAPTHKMPTPQYLLFRGKALQSVSPQDGSMSLSVYPRVCLRVCVCAPACA